MNDNRKTMHLNKGQLLIESGSPPEVVLMGRKEKTTSFSRIW